MTTDELVQINKNAFIQAGNIAVKSVIFSAFPFLGIPPLLSLSNMAINWLVTKMANQAEIGAFFIYTDMRVSNQGDSFVKASQLVNQLMNDKTATPEQIKAAQNDANAKFISFFNLAE